MSRAPVLQACLNGGRAPGEHPDLPLAADALAAQAALAWTAGAHGVHVHPRDVDGAETLAPGVCAEAVAAIRAAIDGRDEPSRSARERILSGLTWERATRRLIEILSEAFDGRSSPRPLRVAGAKPPG